MFTAHPAAHPCYVAIMNRNGKTTHTHTRSHIRLPTEHSLSSWCKSTFLCKRCTYIMKQQIPGLINMERGPGKQHLPSLPKSRLAYLKQLHLCSQSPSHLIRFNLSFKHSAPKNTQGKLQKYIIPLNCEWHICIWSQSLSFFLTVQNNFHSVQNF